MGESPDLAAGVRFFSSIPSFELRYGFYASSRTALERLSAAERLMNPKLDSLNLSSNNEANIRLTSCDHSQPQRVRMLALDRKVKG